MGKIELDHTGSGSGITLSSDGTDLLLDGTAIGGGGGADLYAANESSPTAQPSATGANAIAIGDSATASGADAVAIGEGSTSSSTRSIAIGYNSTSSGITSTALGPSANASGFYGTALGYNARAASGGFNSVVAMGNSYASGADSFAAAIANNTSSYGATGANSVAMGDRAKATTADAIGIGNFGWATGTAGSLAIGAYSRSSGSYATAYGYDAVASNTSSTAIGHDTTASGAYSAAIGSKANSTNIGQFSLSNNGFGWWQAGIWMLGLSTTDATATVMTTNNNIASTNNQIVLPNNSAFSFHGTIVAREQAADGTDCAAWEVKGLIRREGSASTTTLVNSATTVLDNTPSWGLALSADTTNGCLKVQATGAASTDIRWVATIHTSEVTYA